MENLRPLKVDQKKRPLISAEELEKLLAVAQSLPKSGQFLADVLRLTCACGSRITETLRLRWPDVDFARKQLTIGADGLAKNRKHRVVDFNRNWRHNYRTCTCAGRRIQHGCSPRRATTARWCIALTRNAP
jgi:integrase